MILPLLFLHASSPSSSSRFSCPNSGLFCAIGAFLQSLTAAGLRVDGKRELVHHDDEDEDDSGDGGGEGDVPALNGTPGDVLVNVASLGGATDNDGAGEGGAGVTDELAARAVNAAGSVILESADNANVHEEGDDHGDGDQGSEEHSDNTGEGHADSEDELVADAVKEEGEEEHQQDEAGNEGNEDESLRGLGHVADVVRGLVVLEGGGGAGDSASVGGDSGLDTVEVVVDLGLVDGEGAGGEGASGSSSGGLLELVGLLKLVPRSHSSSDHESHDRGSEDNSAAVARGEGGGHRRKRGGKEKKQNREKERRVKLRIRERRRKKRERGAKETKRKE